MNNEDETYNVLNALTDNLLSKKYTDTIFIRKKTYNEHLKSIIENKKIIPKLKNDKSLIDIFSRQNEIDYIANQLNKEFFIDFNKINSKKVEEYIDPFERKGPNGSIIIDHNYYKVTTSICYSLSKPLITRNKLFSFILVSTDDLGVQIQAFKKENNKWKLYKYISMPKN